MKCLFLGIYGEKRLGEVFPKRSFAFPFLVKPNHPKNMMPSCRSAKMMNVAYRLKTRVVLRDHGQQRSPDQAYSSFSHQLPFKIRAGSTPNQATLDAIQRAQRIAESVDGSHSEKQASASTDAFQIQASLSNPVTNASTSSAIEALVRLEQIHQSSKGVSKIIGKLIQVKIYGNKAVSLAVSACSWKTLLLRVNKTMPYYFLPLL